MASTLAFLTDYVSSSSVRRHWLLVILLSSLLAMTSLSPAVARAESDLRLYPLEGSEDSSLPINSSVPLDNPFQLLPNLHQKSSGNPLVTIKLSSSLIVPDSSAILRISSFESSSSNDFLLEISTEPSDQGSHKQAILYGFLGVTATNLCALGGLVCIPVSRWRHYNRLLTFMVSLAVGALMSTAILVLIPETMRMLHMPAEFGGESRRYLIKMSCVVIGCLFFYALEYFLTIMPKLCKWNIASNESVDSKAELIGKPSAHGHSHGLPVLTVSNQGDVESDEFNDSYSSEVDSVIPEKLSCCTRFSVGCRNLRNISPLAWMILIGDGCHNFMDGLTIGAGFSKDPTIGLTLTLSVLFEELPHELGDFAVLLSSGMSVKAALLANFASACVAYFGLAFGIVIGDVPSGALYVFGVTAGIFLYISLSDMLPSLRDDIQEAGNDVAMSFRIFMIQYAGMIIGVGAVLTVTICSDFIHL